MKKEVNCAIGLVITQCMLSFLFPSSLVKNGSGKKMKMWKVRRRWWRRQWLTQSDNNIPHDPLVKTVMIYRFSYSGNQTYKKNGNLPESRRNGTRQFKSVTSTWNDRLCDSHLSSTQAPQTLSLVYSSRKTSL